ncbi:GNAT family N-acetyltransferase [Capnocytophaga catalasegens]|uniref:N-acetyltransferase n=1 Tax=Capnocytophaga catalasegens TaxID=1004260 RepID=A0AAV5AUK5_9FLAO|nr:GNAT family N-acetyltransferase [Capnocytophaga catalasegens]GIZ15394.1 N-acetyltransferase [Capnocytophaga catalasegens]GJM50982.1 N-acetyltransferase [Capnocytophaga catalasegens]GJM52166.1 N-acetyltransferase [Capnocytophaga catalasegens]
MIRPATRYDAQQVAPLMFQAMEDIVYKIIGKTSANEGIRFLKILFEQEHNQYSFQNAFVYELHNEIVGSVVFYNGADLHRLRQPVLTFAQKQYNHTIILEDETQAGEYYLDTLSVSPNVQGKGIGSQLIAYLIEHIASKTPKCIGLLVDEKNPKAERLYTSLGFKFQSIKKLAGGTYKHLTYNYKSVD